MLKKSKHVGHGYIPPGRNEIGGKYLEANYNVYREKALNKIREGGKMYGVDISG